MVTNVIYPQKAYINALTNATKAVATFTANHDFTVGEMVTFHVSSDFGMFEINQKRGKVLSLTSDTITVDIDTNDWTAFDYSALNSAGTTPPHCTPCCSVKVPNSNPPRVNQVAAFDNRRS